MEPREHGYDELCRLCASYDAVKMGLFSQEGKNRQLVDKIQACLPFKVAEDDRLPKCLCLRCMFNLENFYDFRTACVNAVSLLETFLSADNSKNDGDRRSLTEHCSALRSELRSELLKEKEHMPILIPEAPVVNPNAALGTPPRLNSDGEADNDVEEVLEQSGTDEAADDAEDRKSEEYELDMETNPSDFLEMPPMLTEDVEENETAIVSPRARVRDSRGFQHKSEQHEVYVCSLCNKAFSSKGHLSLHARIHVGAGDVIGEKVITDDHTSYKRPYQCDLCYKAYSTAKHRWGHVSTSHRGHPAVTCSYCSRIYSTRGNLEEHIRSRHAGLPLPPELPVPYVQPENKYQCKTCPKMYTNTTDLNKHSRICIGSQQKELPNNDPTIEKLKKIQVETSDMSSNDSTNETKDYKNAEAKLAKNPQLTILKQALTKGDILKRSYDEKYKNSSKTKKQAKTDSNDIDVNKLWFCESCPQNFTSFDSFKEHELLHDAKKPYFCLLCEKDFAQKSSLSNHIVTMHGVDPHPIIDSDRCLKKSLLSHGWNKKSEPTNGEPNFNLIKKEEDSSPYPAISIENEEELPSNQDKIIEIDTVFVCEICTRDFNDRASLWLHIRATHKEFAAFACGVCLKICSDNAQLLNHVNMYHGGSKLLMSEQRRYSCTICGRQHDSRKKLITHVSIHNVDPSYDPASFVQLNSNYYNENLNSNEGIEQPIDGDVEDGEKVDCYICYKSFPNEDHLIRHQRNAHKSDPAVVIGESTANGSGTGPNGNGNRAQYHLFYICELCGNSHPSKWERWLHVSSIHGDDPEIKCERPDCAKIFATKTLRNEHAQHHAMQGSSPNTCEICGKLWGSRVDYWKHVMGVHSDTVPLICGVCLKVFPNVLQLSAHVKQKHWPLTNGDFSCDICGRPYSNKSKMSRHRKIHGLDGEGHVLPDPSEYINDSGRLDNGEAMEVDFSCEMCGDLKFLSLEDLCNHRRITHNLFPCDLCNKCYGRTSHLWKHVNRVHKGHKDVTCRFCKKTSASRDHLAAHIAKIHRYKSDVKNDTREPVNFRVAAPEEEVLHHCDRCKKDFYKRYLLRRHMKACHKYRKDPGALLTRCRACERIFKDRASLQKHIENHHSSYTCHLCNETITSKLGIMTHNRINHMDHPDLTCELNHCKKLFRTKEDLESHKKDHRIHATPNVCDFCGDTAENKLKLKMHVLSLHRNEIGVSCGVCLIPMKDPKDLKKHVEDTHRSILLKPNTCQVCGKQYASKWKAFDHTKKCHGKVFKTCKQCLAVFITEESMRNHYEYVHNVPKDQLATFEYRLEIGRKRHYDNLEVVMKEEPEELEFDEEPAEDYSNDYKKGIYDSDDYDARADFYSRMNNEQEEQMRPLKKMKLDSKAKKKVKERQTYECENCKVQFNTKTQFWNHINLCPKRNMITKEEVTSFPTSILEAHLKNNNLIKREEPEQELDENNLNIPDFNLFEDINMQLSGQKPVQNLSLKSSSGSNKCSRKDSRKVYDESTNTECTCEVCGKQWPAKKHLWQHLIRFHRAEAAVTCGVCLKLCTTYDDLAYHLKAAHEALLSCEGNNFTCKVCGRYHNARSKLLLHMSIHINCKNNPMCKKCKRSFETEEKLKEHIGNCEGRQSGLGIRHDAEDVKNEDNDENEDNDDNDEKGSFIGDEGDEREEKEGNYGSGEEKGSDNEDSSSDDSADSGTDSSSTSSDDENENEENEVAAESRNKSRLGELSCTSDSEEDSDSEALEDVAEIKSNVRSEDGRENLVSKDAKMEGIGIESTLVLSESDTKDSTAFGGLENKLRKIETNNMDYSDDEGPPVLSPMMPLLPPQEEDMNSQMDEMSHKLSPMVTLETKMEQEMQDCNFEDMQINYQKIEDKNQTKDKNLEESEDSESESEDENKMCIYEEAGNRETKPKGTSAISDDEEDAEMQEETKEEGTAQEKGAEVASAESEEESENEEVEEEEDEESENESEQVQIANHSSPATIDHSETLSQDLEGEDSDQEEVEEAEEAEEAEEGEEGEEEEDEDEEVVEEEPEENFINENAEVEEELVENNSLVEEEVIGEENYEDEAMIDDEMNNEEHSLQNLNKTILTVGKDAEGNPILIREVVTQYPYQDEYDCESEYPNVSLEQTPLFNADENQRLSGENFGLNSDSLDQTMTEPEVQTVDELDHHEEVETDEQVEDKADSDIEESRTSAKS